MEDDIFSYEDYEDIDECTIQYYNVKFKVDFGSFKKDETYDHLAIDFCSATMTHYDANGNVVKTLNVKLVPA